MRKIYIVSPDQIVDQPVQDAATAAGCSEIAQGIPTRMTREGVTNPYPFVHTEQDDPAKPGRALAIQVLRNTFRQTRTPAQINNTLDALTLLLKQTISELNELT